MTDNSADKELRLLILEDSREYMDKIVGLFRSAKISFVKNRAEFTEALAGFSPDIILGGVANYVAFKPSG